MDTLALLTTGAELYAMSDADRSRVQATARLIISRLISRTTSFVRVWRAGSKPLGLPSLLPRCQR
ncbi:hypothetical protein ABCR94_16010 [Streptomyces sp. 21So2-11]|uniref:hypothetical protein n=1 Tax=Streptomyces sp. 21So2-11 TaxID=3144408 RepID=UPI0032194E6B